MPCAHLARSAGTNIWTGDTEKGGEMKKDIYELIGSLLGCIVIVSLAVILAACAVSVVKDLFW